MVIYQKNHFHPVFTDIFYLRIVVYLRYIHWYMSWVWRFYIKKEEYGRDEQIHLMRKLMGFSQGQFDNMEVSQNSNILFLCIHRSNIYCSSMHYSHIRSVVWSRIWIRPGQYHIAGPGSKSR